MCPSDCVGRMTMNHSLYSPLQDYCWSLAGESMRHSETGVEHCFDSLLGWLVWAIEWLELVQVFFADRRYLENVFFQAIYL